MKQPFHKSDRARRSAAGAAALVVAAVVSASGVASAADLTVAAGSPKVLSAAESSVYYNSVAVNDDLTIDGANGAGLTNSSSIAIGASATHPVTVVVTNGAKWVVAKNQTMTFSGKGGTLIASSSVAPDFSLNDAVPTGVGTARPNAFGTVGYNTYVKIGADAVAEGGVMDIARILPNGTVSFSNVENSNPDVAARILFEGGTHWLLSDDSKKLRFSVANDAKIILESVDGNPITIRNLLQDYRLFAGAGTLETRGDGDFVLYIGDKSYTATLSCDEDGEILWNHKGRFVLSGPGNCKIGADNVLPFGPQTGPVVFSNTEWVSGLTPPRFDLNGKTVAVNGIFVEGGYGKFTVITNSSESVATLLLNVETNAVLSGLIDNNVNFAANALSNIRLGKTGAGTLTVDKMFPVAGFDVVEGLIVGTANVSVGSVTATNGAALMVKSPYFNKTDHNSGLNIETLAIDAGDGAAVLSNVWQNALVVRGGTARVENGAVNILAAERPWRPAKSQIGSVSVDGGVLDVVRGCLSSTNITIAADATLRIRGGAGATNRVDFYTTSLSDHYYRFIFKESYNKNSFALNHLFLRASDGTREFSVLNSETPKYTLNQSAASASSLSAGEYMYSCPSGVEFVERDDGTRSYSASGLSARASWGGVIINENKGLSLDSPNTWVTLTIRLREGASLPLVGYQLYNDTVVGNKVTIWEVQASDDGETWRTVDSRARADIYSSSNAASSDPDKEGYGYFNGGEPFGWRCLAADNVFYCGGTVQVDEGGMLDLSAVPDANVSIKSITVDVPSGGGTITKFRPAADGVVNITGLVGELPNRYALPLSLSAVTDIDNLKTWTVAVDGVVVRKTEVVYSDGVLSTHKMTGLTILVR